MKHIITGSIDLSKVPEGKIIDGKYVQFQAYIDTDAPDPYGNHIKFVQQQTKEQREAKEAHVYFGNARIISTKK